MRKRLLLLIPASAAWLAACAGAPPRPGPAAAAIVESARRQIGAPYKFGGRSPAEGFDCSGLAWWLYEGQGVSLPVTAAEQFKAGSGVRGRPRPADLVFFSTAGSGPSHVGIVSGRDTFIHAPKDGYAVREESLEDPYWVKNYLGARRYLRE